jgi:hypothetical protein
MVDLRRVELDELVNRPGTYFHPGTEVLLIVDDSPEIDAEIFSDQGLEAAEWVLISDETPVDEHRRDELLQAFAVQHQPGALVPEDEEEEDEEDDLEPDELDFE